MIFFQQGGEGAVDQRHVRDIEDGKEKKGQIIFLEEIIGRNRTDFKK